MRNLVIYSVSLRIPRSKSTMRALSKMFRIDGVCFSLVDGHKFCQDIEAATRAGEDKPTVEKGKYTSTAVASFMAAAILGVSR